MSILFLNLLYAEQISDMALARQSLAYAYSICEIGVPSEDRRPSPFPWHLKVLKRDIHHFRSNPKLRLIRNSSPSFQRIYSTENLALAKYFVLIFPSKSLQAATLTARPIVGEDRKEGVKLAAEVTRPQLRRSLERALSPPHPACPPHFPSPQNKSPRTSPLLPTLSGKGRRNHFKTLPPGETERERSRVGGKWRLWRRGSFGCGRFGMRSTSPLRVLFWERSRDGKMEFWSAVVSSTVG